MIKTLFFLFISFSLFAGDLDLSSIPTIVNEALSQHVDHKKLDEDLIQKSVKSYIEAFDPHKIYLLEEEVVPYFSLSSSQAKESLNELKQGKFPLFQKLDTLFEKAVKRARLFREEVISKVTLVESFTEDSYATTEAELKERITSFLGFSLFEESKKYGKRYVEERKGSLLNTLSLRMNVTENNFLLLGRDGKELPPEAKERAWATLILKAIFKGLDAHTNFLDPSQALDMRVRLEKGMEGVGIVLEEGKEGLLIKLVLPGSPAERSQKIQPGDRLTKVNGEDVTNYDLARVMDVLRESPSVLNLSLERDGKTIDVSLKKEMIQVNEDRVTVTKERFGNGYIGVIKLNTFYQSNDGLITSERDVKQAIETLNQEGNLLGLVLDLRDNSGGFLSQAVKVAGLFITNGVVVISKYANNEEKVYRDMDGKTSYQGPLIVLTSKLTASAAEIVAQALQDYGVALIVGDEQTFGKGTIQSQTVTDPNGGTQTFKVTVGKYYTVSGKTPQKEGVKADIIVPGPLHNEKIGEEYLEYALPNDEIAAEFQDDLGDINPSLRSWYLRYYIPTLQSQEHHWDKFLDLLRGNSKARIDKNKNYQFLLFKKSDDNVSAAEEEIFPETGNKNSGVEDLQLNEAKSILKDMIQLDLQQK